MTFVPLTISRDTAVVPLTQGQYALIDAEAWFIIGNMTWQYHEGYAVNARGIRMHWLVCPVPSGRKVADHINRNPLDNRRSNLRPASKQQNAQNNSSRRSSTGFKGAYWDKSKSCYVAKISVNSKLLNIGQFDNPLDAAKAYDEKAREFYGVFASTNFPSQG